jgi:two-component SAPR family response regulator
VYRLDPALVEVDFWRFVAAVAARRATGVEADRVSLYSAIVGAYAGTLAEGLATSWIEPLRQAARRDALDALAALARLSVESDPERTLELLEMARGFDPHNELVYRDIMRLQARLGRLDAIPRTLTLLEAHLVEIGEQPTSETVGLAVRLQRHQDAPSVSAGRSPDQ